jgi:hypothetical protein
MMSRTPTLLDPFEVERGSHRRLRVAIPDDATEWFDRAALLEEIALLWEISEPPPWTPEPVDRRWRARCWDEDALGW